MPAVAPLAPGLGAPAVAADFPAVQPASASSAAAATTVYRPRLRRIAPYPPISTSAAGVAARLDGTYASRYENPGIVPPVTSGVARRLDDRPYLQCPVPAAAHRRAGGDADRLAGRPSSPPTAAGWPRSRSRAGRGPGSPHVTAPREVRRRAGTHRQRSAMDDH